MDQFWLTDEQFAKIAPHLPTNTRGKPRVDDRRVISGIVHVLKSGGRWVDAPAAYGPKKTLYNRFVRWGLLHADKGYDSDAIRRQIEAKGTAPNIPPKANRVWKPCFSPVLYRGRNAIERMFCRLKDFRRVATRYDRIATNYLAAVCLAATVSYWL